VTAKNLGRRLNLPVISLDKYIENQEGGTIQKVVENRGWEYFRECEERCMIQLLSKDSFILDTGGGILEGGNHQYSEKKADLLKKNFFRVYLSIEDRVVLDRLRKLDAATHRPPLPGGNDSVLERRKPWFEKNFDLKVDTTRKTPDKVANEIKNYLEKQETEHSKEAVQLRNNPEKG